MKHVIAVVDDHVLIAKALKSIIANFERFEVRYECENGRELQKLLKNKKNIPDIVLLDVSMPIMNGFETAAWLKNNHPNILVLALSMQDDEMSVVRMIKNGAKGYLLKNAHPTELEAALINMVDQGHYYPDWAASKIFDSIADKVEDPGLLLLNDREKEFLRLTITEMSYKEIAVSMCCSPRTVEGYRDTLFHKLKLKSRVGLAVYTIRNELV